MSSGITDFNQYSHGQLRAMAEALNSGDVMSAGDPWRRAADVLKQIRAALGTASGAAVDTWEGSSSDAFYAAMTKLANSVNNTAAYANDAANTLKLMSEAMDRAKHDMPEEPGFWDQVGSTVADTWSSALGDRSDTTQIPLADRRKAQAVAVMQTLAAKYRVAVGVLKPPPQLVHEDPDVPPPDPTVGEALSALVLGAGFGALGSFHADPAGPVSRPAPIRSAPRATRPRTSADPGITGGVAGPSPKLPQSGVFGTSSFSEVPAPIGPGTGLDSTDIPMGPLSPSGVGGFANSSAAASGGVGGFPNTPATAPGGSGGFVNSPAPRSDWTDPGGAPPRFVDRGAERVSVPGRAISGEGSGVPVGGTTRVGREPSGEQRSGYTGLRGEAGAEPEQFGRSFGGTRKAFTEGGTGLGARYRAQAAQDGPAFESPAGFVPGASQEVRRKKRRKGHRAEYLVEDGQAWVSEEETRSGVVE
ncbi:hypothetical protein ACFW1A_28800 [Kitasatospora sp. NPDC058965]|uniref:hypothetical protein n=1 Tax=Kitasatospora sp. NPDC058965 TaxID=3346682 RepID=UPI0036D07C31